MNTMTTLPVAGPTSSVTMVPQTEAAAMMTMIERAARDPSVDIDKMKQLMDMAQALKMRDAEQAFNEAMATVQGLMRPVAADASNPTTHSRYASYFALDKALRPIYSAHGFGLSYDTEDSPKADHVRIVCYVTRGIFTRKYRIDMPADGKGAKGGDVMTKTHATGSAATYGQRYLLKMIFNIAIGIDDDGNAAGDTTVEGVTDQQIAELRALIKEVKADEEKVCKACRVESLEQLTLKLYGQAKAKLETMRSPL
jgi:ERF superfamily protein